MTKSKAVSLIQLGNFVNALPELKNDLTRIKQITVGLRVNASQLSDGLFFIILIIFFVFEILC